MSETFYFDYTITPDELTKPYQHVHHAHAIRLLELGRLAFLEKINYSLEKQLNLGFLLVIVSLAVRYKRELFAEKIRIALESVIVDGRKINMHQKILNRESKVVIEAEVGCAFMDLKTKRSIIPPLGFVEALV